MGTPEFTLIVHGVVERRQHRSPYRRPAIACRAGATPPVVVAASCLG